MGIEKIFKRKGLIKRAGLALGTLAMAANLYCITIVESPTNDNSNQNTNMNGNTNSNENNNFNINNNTNSNDNSNGNNNSNSNNNGNTNTNDNGNTNGNTNNNANGNDNTNGNGYSLNYIGSINTYGDAIRLDWGENGSLLVGESFDGIEIFDVSNVENPSFLGRYASLDEVVNFQVEVGKLYVAEAFRGISVVDVSDPTNPTRIGLSPDLGGVYEDVLVLGTVTGHPIIFSANSPLGVIVYDATDPSHINHIRTINTGSSGAAKIHSYYEPFGPDRFAVRTSFEGDTGQTVDIKIYDFPLLENLVSSYTIPGGLIEMDGFGPRIYAFPDSGGFNKLRMVGDNFILDTENTSNKYFIDAVIDGEIVAFANYEDGVEIRSSFGDQELLTEVDTNGKARSVIWKYQSGNKYLFVADEDDVEIYKLNEPN